LTAQKNHRRKTAPNLNQACHQTFDWPTILAPGWYEEWQPRLCAWWFGEQTITKGRVVLHYAWDRHFDLSNLASIRVFGV